MNPDNQPVTIAAAAAAVPELVEEVKALKDEVCAGREAADEERKAAREKHQSNQRVLRLLVVVTVIAAVSAGLGAVGTWALVDGRTTTRNLLDTIEGCLSPEGECTQTSRERQTETVERVQIGTVESMVDLVACQYRPDAEEFRECAAAAVAEMQSAAAVEKLERAADLESGG